MTRTAILVIHGIGEQNPYETLDQFARGFAGYFTGQGTAPTLRPERIRHEGWTEVAVHLEFPHANPRSLERLSIFEFYWAPYTEGKVTDRGVLWWLLRTALTPLRYLADNLQALLDTRDTNSPSRRAGLLAREVVRIALVYAPVLLIVAAILAGVKVGVPTFAAWVEGAAAALRACSWSWAMAAAVAWIIVITLAWFVIQEVRQWLRRPAAGTTDPAELRRSNLRAQRAAERTWVALALVLMAGVAVLALQIPSLAHAGQCPVPPWRTAAPVGGALLAALFLRRVLVGYVGDIAVYCTADEKAASYEARSQILHGSTEALQRLLIRKQEAFDQVILAGHSLGSVIAYDSINALLSRVWSTPDNGTSTSPTLDRTHLDKLRGLVTFGSPLDKVYYFFREHVPTDQAVRAQILSFLHSFMRGYSGRYYGPFKFTYQDDGASAFPTLGAAFQWLNVWSPMDPVSGPLRFYRLAEGDRVRRWYWLWGVAHLAYWSDKKLYSLIAERFLRGPAGGKPQDVAARPLNT